MCCSITTSRYPATSSLRRPIEDVMQRICETDDFKFNAALVIIDFAIRHGVLTPEDPEYIAVTEGMRLGRAGRLGAR